MKQKLLQIVPESKVLKLTENNNTNCFWKGAFMLLRVGDMVINYGEGGGSSEMGKLRA